MLAAWHLEVAAYDWKRNAWKRRIAAPAVRRGKTSWWTSPPFYFCTLAFRRTLFPCQRQQGWRFKWRRRARQPLFPKPMKLLKPHYETLASYFETMTNSVWKKDLADILSVLALLCLTAEGETESFKYRLLGSEHDITSWGGKCMRKKLGNITEKIVRLRRESLLKQAEDISDSPKGEDADARPVGVLKLLSPYSSSQSASAPHYIEKGSTSNIVPLGIYFDSALQEELIKHIEWQEHFPSKEPAAPAAPAAAEAPAAPAAAEAPKQFRTEAQRDAKLKRREQYLKRLTKWSEEERRKGIEDANKRVRMELEVGDIRLNVGEVSKDELDELRQGEPLEEGGEEPAAEDEGGDEPAEGKEGVL